MKTFKLEPVGYKYKSGHTLPTVHQDLIRQNGKTVYSFELVSYGRTVLQVTITVTQAIKINFQTTEEVIFNDLITMTTSRHIIAFLNYITQQSGQPIDKIFRERYQGKSIKRKMQNVPYIN